MYAKCTQRTLYNVYIVFCGALSGMLTERKFMNRNPCVICRCMKMNTMNVSMTCTETEAMGQFFSFRSFLRTIFFLYRMYIEYFQRRKKMMLGAIAQEAFSLNLPLNSLQFFCDGLFFQPKTFILVIEGNNQIESLL